MLDHETAHLHVAPHPDAQNFNYFLWHTADPDCNKFPVGSAIARVNRDVKEPLKTHLLRALDRGETN